MKYMSTKEAATKWGISAVRVFTLIQNGRIPGAKLVGKSWLIPADTEKPTDGRKRKDDNRFLWPLPILYGHTGGSSLSREEEKLLRAQEMTYRCQMDEAIPILLEFQKPGTNFYLKLGSLYTIFYCYLFKGDFKNLRKTVNTLSFMRKQDFPHKTDCEGLFLDLESYTLGNKNFLKNNLVDKEYHYCKEAIPCLVLLCCFKEVLLSLDKKNVTKLQTYELFGMQFEEEDNLFAACVLYTYIATICKLQGDRASTIFYLKKALKIVRSTGYIIPVVINMIHMRDEFEECFLPEDEELSKSITCCEKQYRKNYVALLLLVKTKRILYYVFSEEDFRLYNDARLGKSNKEVAAEMGLSENTISKKYNTLHEKAGVISKQELIDRFEETLFLFQ